MVEIPINVVITPANVRQTKKEVLKAFDAIEDQAKKTGRGVSKGFEKGFKNMIENIKKVRAQWVALAGVITGGIVGGLASLTRGALEYADAITKVADRVGVSTTELQEFRLMGQLTGVDVRTMDQALQRFSRRTGEVDRNMGELLKTAEYYNAEVRDGEGNVKTNIDLLKEWSATVQNASSTQEQLAITFKLVDSEGAKLVNLLRLGPEGIENLREEIDRLGVVIEERLLRDAARAIDSLTKLQAVVKATFTRAVVENAEAIAMQIERMVNWMISLLPETRKLEDLEVELAVINKKIQEQTKSLEDNAKAWQDMGAQVRGAPTGFARELTDLSKLERQREKLLDQIKRIRDFRSRYGGVITGEGEGGRPTTYPSPAGMFEVYDEEMARSEEKARAIIEEMEEAALAEAEKVKDSWMLMEEGRVEANKRANDIILAQQQQHSDEVNSVVNASFSSWQRGIDNFIETGKLNFSSLVDSMIKDLAKLGANKIFQMIIGDPTGGPGGMGTGISGFISRILPSAKGNVVKRYAKGGLITEPTIFPARRGMALAGEAGTEAIMPLQRDRRGRLGVSGGGQVVNIYNIQAVDTQSFAEAARKSGAIPLLAAEGVQTNTILRDAVLNAR